VSYGAPGAPHAGPCEGGEASDSPRGSLWITTLRKLPTTAPSTPIAATAAAMARPSW
jgi:hypothetical protein